jgi:hypothetical protein
LLPIHLTAAAAALGISSSPHQQGSSGQGKEQQALHLGLERVPIGSVSALLLLVGTAPIQLQGRLPTSSPLDELMTLPCW